PALRARIVQAIEGALGGDEPVAVATAVSAGEPALLEVGAKVLVRRDGSQQGSLGDAGTDVAVVRAAAEMFATVPRLTMQTLYAGAGGVSDRRSQAGDGAAEVMVQLFEAPARMVIVGAGHVGLALATVAEHTGFSVTVIDDREEFATRERFPM